MPQRGTETAAKTPGPAVCGEALQREAENIYDRPKVAARALQRVARSPAVCGREAQARAICPLFYSSCRGGVSGESLSERFMRATARRAYQTARPPDLRERAAPLSGMRPAIRPTRLALYQAWVEERFWP